MRGNPDYFGQSVTEAHGVTKVFNGIASLTNAHTSDDLLNISLKGIMLYEQFIFLFPNGDNNFLFYRDIDGETMAEGVVSRPDISEYYLPHKLGLHTIWFDYVKKKAAFCIDKPISFNNSYYTHVSYPGGVSISVVYYCEYMELNPI